MKNKVILWMITFCLGMTVLTGCSGEQKKIYNQAAADLEQGSYEYALQEYEITVSAGYKTAESYCGAGICKLHLGSYEEAIEYFTNGLNCEKVSKDLKRDLLAYRATAQLKAELLDAAMADCQTLAENFTMDADLYYLTGCVALAMDSYDEASNNFTEAYGAEPGYDMAIQIYEAYVDKDMEADGTRYLEAALKSEPKTADDYCERGRAYYYMEDYASAQQELTEAVNKNSKEGMLLLGMTYRAQGNTAGARSMYQQYLESEPENPATGYNGLALCDIDEKSYDSALENISKGLQDASAEEMQDLLFNEIVVYEEKLDFSTALSKIQEYVAMFPDDESAAKELIFLQSRTGNLTGTDVESEADADSTVESQEN